MANEFVNSLKTAAEKVSHYVQEAAELKVQTRYIVMGDSSMTFENAPAAAETVIRLDGDSYVTMPMRVGENKQLEVDTALYTLHQQNVQSAIEYRASILDALLQVLRPQ